MSRLPAPPLPVVHSQIGTAADSELFGCMLPARSAIREVPQRDLWKERIDIRSARACLTASPSSFCFACAMLTARLLRPHTYAFVAHAGDSQVRCQRYNIQERIGLLGGFLCVGVLGCAVVELESSMDWRCHWKGPRRKAKGRRTGSDSGDEGKRRKGGTQFSFINRNRDGQVQRPRQG